MRGIASFCVKLRLFLLNMIIYSVQLHVYYLIRKEGDRGDGPG
jgi:hypothetical protein